VLTGTVYKNEIENENNPDVHDLPWTIMTFVLQPYCKWALFLTFRETIWVCNLPAPPRAGVTNEQPVG